MCALLPTVGALGRDYCLRRCLAASLALTLAERAHRAAHDTLCGVP